MADRHGPSNPAADDTHQRPRLRVVRPDEGHDADGALRTMRLGAADLELGGRINDVTLAYRTWGTLNAAGDNAVIILHALTGAGLLRRMDALGRDLAAAAEALEARSPLKVLARGYSLLSDEATGRVIRAPEDAAPGQRLRARLARGELVVRVE